MVWRPLPGYIFRISVKEVIACPAICSHACALWAKYVDSDAWTGYTTWNISTNQIWYASDVVSSAGTATGFERGSHSLKWVFISLSKPDSKFSTQALDIRTSHYRARWFKNARKRTQSRKIVVTSPKASWWCSTVVKRGRAATRLLQRRWWGNKHQGMGHKRYGSIHMPKQRMSL